MLAQTRFEDETLQQAMRTPIKEELSLNLQDGPNNIIILYLNNHKIEIAAKNFNSSIEVILNSPHQIPSALA